MPPLYIYNDIQVTKVNAKGMSLLYHLLPWSKSTVNLIVKGQATISLIFALKLVKVKGNFSNQYNALIKFCGQNQSRHPRAYASRHLTGVADGCTIVMILTPPCRVV